MPSIPAAAKAAAKGSVLSSATRAAAAAQQKAKDAATTAAAKEVFGAEAGTLITGSGGISSISSGFQSFTASAKSFGSWYFNALFNFGDPNIGTITRIGAWLPFILIGIAIFAYFAITREWFVKKDAAGVSESAKASTEAIGNTLNATTANAPAAVTTTTPITTSLSPSGSTTTQISPDQYTLLALQPRAIKQVGYIGPLNNGSFDVSSGVSQTLRSGFRFLILQIDYLETAMDPTKFPATGIPTLLYRGDDGSLLSTNSADIGEVAQMIAGLAFRPEVPNYTEPLLIYLHILRAPSPIRSSDAYLNFLSAIATALNPLAPTHLNTTSLGVFTRQKQEDVLINTPLSAFSGQTIVLCNADTSIFRSTAKQIAPANDLDYWVNIRVYLESSDYRIGVSKAPETGVVPSAIIMNLRDLLFLSDEEMDNFAFKTKSTFVIALPQQLANPSTDELGIALNQLSVNVVPLDIFSTDITTVRSLIDEYSGMTFRPKQPSLLPAAKSSK